RREELDALAREANNLQAEKSKLVALNDQALAHQQAMTELRSTRAEALAGLQQQIDADREMLAELEADAAALSTLVRGLPRPGQNRPLPDTGGSTAKSLAQPPSGPATPGSLQEQDIDRAKGKLPWPATGRIVQTPGSRQRAGGAVWNGMLIATEPAAEVHAIAAGTVVFADEFRNLGLLVIVDHGQEYLSLYGYNQAVHRQAGDHVSAGDLLAEVGAHGTAGQYALYFELRHNGAALDPRQWLLPR
ncbi:MAG: peptidoglycan DD-metalloendopeptidase family protein, partial [Gammaproteobacteria bacterium]|nr:peptidoglycan DD-metalloendopeptidase family protein [Gammaproteobacteria bacterium]